LAPHILRKAVHFLLQKFVVGFTDVLRDLGGEVVENLSKIGKILRFTQSHGE
jgi:hypothetical protein